MSTTPSPSMSPVAIAAIAASSGSSGIAPGSKAPGAPWTVAAHSRARQLKPTAADSRRPAAGGKEGTGLRIRRGAATRTDRVAASEKETLVDGAAAGSLMCCSRRCALTAPDVGRARAPILSPQGLQHTVLGPQHGRQGWRFRTSAMPRSLSGFGGRGENPAE